MDPKQRRASDGVLCVVKETSSDTAPSRGHKSLLLSYKTEPGAAQIILAELFFPCDSFSFPQIYNLVIL